MEIRTLVGRHRYLVLHRLCVLQLLSDLYEISPELVLPANRRPFPERVHVNAATAWFEVAGVRQRILQVGTRYGRGDYLCRHLVGRRDVVLLHACHRTGLAGTGGC